MTQRLECPDYAELRRLYEEEGWSKGQLVVHYGHSEPVIKRWLREAGADLRQYQGGVNSTVGQLQLLDRELMERMYLRQGHSLSSIARTTGVSVEVVRRSARRYGMDKPVSQPVTALDPQAVLHCYTERGMGVNALAKRFNVGRARITEILQRHDVLRTQRPNNPRRMVVRHEELPYRTTQIGRVLTKTVAILECGHKHRVPYTYGRPIYLDHYHCRTCGRQENP